MKYSQTWDKKFIDLVNHIANWSKDKSTKVGAVIVNDRNKILSVGYNGFPIGVNDNIDERHARPTKYKWTAHAEENAILSSAEIGVSLTNCKIYCNYLPCPRCCRAIIQSGIKEIIYQHETVNSQNTPDPISKEMLNEARIRVRQYE